VFGIEGEAGYMKLEGPLSILCSTQRSRERDYQPIIAMAYQSSCRGVPSRCTADGPGQSPASRSALQ
jgi:hypothetical protein